MGGSTTEHGGFCEVCFQRGTRESTCLGEVADVRALACPP